MIMGQFDRTSDRVDWQVPQGIAFEIFCHTLLGFFGQPSISEEFWSVEFIDRRHIDAIKAGSDDRRTSDPDVNFFSSA
jgi:hypothetical protein